MVRSIAGAANEIREKVQSQIDSRGASGQASVPAGSAMGAPAVGKGAPKAKAAPKVKGKAKK